MAFASFNPDAAMSGKIATLKPAAIKLLYILTAHNQDRSGIVWPSRESILRLTGISRATFFDAQKELVSAGLISVVKTQDRTEFHILDGSVQDANTHENPSPESRTPVRNLGLQSRISDCKSPESRTKKSGDLDSYPIGGKRKGIRKEGERVSVSQNATSPSRANSDPQFGELCRVFPNRTGERGALREWRTLKARGEDMDAIIEAAERYREQCEGNDPRFQKSLINWLRDGHFSDGETFTDPMEKAKSIVRKIRAGRLKKTNGFDWTGREHKAGYTKLDGRTAIVCSESDTKKIPVMEVKL